MKAQIDMKKMEQQERQSQQKNMSDMAKLKQGHDKLMADLYLGQQSSHVQLVKAQTERYAKHVDLEIKKFDMKHRHIKEALETNHKLRQKPEGSRANAH